MKTYLIQRAVIEDRDWKTGIDSIISLDYMGSAEFEFGAVFNSLKNIRANVTDYTYLDVPLMGKIITVYCRDDQKTEIKQYLKDLANDEIRLKERSEFNDCVNPSEHEKKWQAKHPLSTNFWWDLDNNLMFWVMDSEFEAKFKVNIVTYPKPSQEAERQHD